MDEMKRKLGAKLQETEAQLEAALTKAASLDKNNKRLKGELEDLTIEVERVSIPTVSFLLQRGVSRTGCPTEIAVRRLQHSLDMVMRTLFIVVHSFFRRS